MTHRTYIVVLKEGVDYNTVWQEIESATTGLSHVPDRPVAIVNERRMFKRICEYELTDAEAQTLMLDTRIESVEIPVRDLPNVEAVDDIVQNAFQLRMTYSKPPGNNTLGIPPFPLYAPYPLNAAINWGLVRHIYRSSPYGVNLLGFTGLQTSQNYVYALDGTEIDVIINDSGIQSNHPEFTNSVGQSRVRFVDWDSIARTLGFSQNPLPNRSWNNLSYSDSGDIINSHGTHVAGIAVGKTYGWAKNANIISLYYSTRGQSSNDPLDTFEMMLYWHLNKVNKNPTIVNMSWGLRILSASTDSYYGNITGGSYRGTTILPGQTGAYYQARGLIPLTGNGFPAQGNTIGLPYTSVAYNAALSELINAGIVVIRSAGNNSFKIDRPNSEGGTGDYDNYITWNRSPGNIYYNRGASPMDPRAIVVGALDTVTSSIGQDQKASYSCAGPRVDVYAAGTFIMSALPSQSTDGAPYYLNPRFNELIATGTSQAAPQVTGMCTLYLQSHRPANIYSANNCANVQSWVTTNATTNTFYQSGTATSYTDYLSLLGGQPRVAYQPLQGITYARNNAWQQVANVYVRGVSSWQPVKSAYTKTQAGWIQIF